VSDSRELGTLGGLSVVPGDLYVVAVAARGVRSVESVAGMGLAWTRVSGQCSGRGQTSVEVWRGTGEPASGPVIARLDGDAASAVITALRFSGADPWATVGGVLAANSNGPGGACQGGTDGTAIALPLGGVDAGSGAFAFVAMRTAWPTAEGGASVVDSRWWGTGADVTGLGVIGRTATSAGPTTLEAGLDRPTDWAAIAIEIQPLGTTPPPVLRVTPEGHDFGTVFVTGSGDVTFALENAGARDLAVSSVSLVGRDAAEFSIATNPAPCAIPPGASRDLVVRFAPGSGGAKEAVLRIASDDPARPRFDLPLSGVGNASFPAAGIDRSRHDWGAVLVAPGARAASRSGARWQPDVLHQDPEHRAWLLDAEGRPRFLCGAGDPEDFLYREDGDQQAIIDALGTSGANCIYFALVRSHGGDGGSDENPFVGNDPSRGLDPAVLDRWEGWFGQMDANGTVMFLIFYDDGASIWDTGNNVGTAEKQFFEAIVNRFEHHENVVWVIAEEYAERYTKSRTSKLAKIIVEADDRGHAVGIHQNDGLGFDFPADEWISMFLVQDNDRTAGELNDDMSLAFSAEWIVAMAESKEHFWRESGGFVSLDTFRRKNWAIGMGGAYAMALRPFVSAASWPPADRLRACGLQVEFFERTNFHEMAPANELAGLDTQWVLADRAGGSFILYSTHAGTLGLDWEEGLWDLLWFDTRTGQTVEIGGVPSAGVFPKPAGFGSDVALWARRAAGPATTTFVLRNDGTADLAIASVSFSGADAADFGLDSGAEPGSIAPGEEREIVARFQPSSTGPRGTTLRIATNDPDGPVLEVALVGCGVQSDAPDIAGGPAICDFGPVEVSWSMPRSVQVRNDGARDLHVTGTSVFGTSGHGFRVHAGGGAFTLPPGAVRQIDLSFDPTAAGARQAHLRLASDDPDEPQFDLVLAGTGVAGLDVQVVFEESVGGVAAEAHSVTTGESLLGVSGDVYVAAIATRRLRTVTSVVGLGLEWRPVRAQCSARSQADLEVWVAQGEAVSGRVTATLNTTTKSAAIVVARYSGAHGWAPVGAVASANTNGDAGSCGTDGHDAAAYSLGLAPVVQGARALGLVAARQRLHVPGAGLTVREEARAGAGSDMASAVLVDRPVVIEGAIFLDGRLDASTDLAVVGLELRPLGSIPLVPDVAANATLGWGTVVVGDAAEAELAVRNGGDAPLDVRAATLLGSEGGEFSVTDGFPCIVPPGGERILAMRFAPVGEGEREAILRIETGDPDENRVHVRLTGLGTAPPEPTGAGALPANALSLEVRGNPSRAGRPVSLRLALPSEGPVRLEIFDVGGRRVATLADGTFARGHHGFTWRGTDAGGRAVGSGVYFARLSAGGGTVVRKITRVR
jgi:hypothetical protein